ncbi:MAG: hypothetical protein NT116_05530, partial [Candidatus Parcubacteria bacterium]|nr:hypothetical protein [Candidatus Parcubacteria bacterium]
MTQKILLIIVGTIIILGIIILGLRFFSGPEDNWICSNGEWVKHGQPSAPMPTTPCPGTNINTNQQVQNQDVISVSLKLGRKDGDFNTQKTYTFDLPKDFNYTITGEDASSGYIDFSTGDKIVFRLITADYALEEKYAKESYKNSYALSFVGGHTNVLNILDNNFTDAISTFLNSFKIEGQLVFGENTLLNPDQLTVKNANISEELRLYQKQIEENFKGIDLTAYKKTGEGEFIFKPERNISEGYFTMGDNIYSPDKSKFVFITRSGDPDTDVYLGDVINKKYTSIAMCGSDCGYGNAFWLDNNRFILSGSSWLVVEGYNTSQLWLYDLANNKVISFESRPDV